MKGLEDRPSWQKLNSCTENIENTENTENTEND